MSQMTKEYLSDVLNGFAEVMTRLLMEQQQKHLADLNLTLLQSQILRILRREPRPIGQLATALQVSPPAATQLTDRLIRKGLIERRSSPKDRRSVLIALSPKGQRLVDKFRQRRGEIFYNALSPLDNIRQQNITATLETMLEALKQYEAQITQQK